MMEAMAIRICIVAADDELRSWIVDELRLMSWMTAPAVDAHASLADLQPDGATIVIVGLDRLATGELDRLRARTWTAPVIGVGDGGADLRLARVLGARLTSRELKLAIRELLAAANEPAAPREFVFR